MLRKTFCSFSPSFKEARLAYETPPDPKDPPAPAPKPKEDDDSAKARVEGALKKAKEAEERAAAAEAKLKAIDDAKQAEEDEKAKKKGEYEKLLSERDEKLTTLTNEQNASKQKLDAFEKVLKGQLDTALKAITDEQKRKTVEKLLEGKDLADQVSLLPEVLQAIGANAPATFGGATPASTTTASATEVEQQKKRYAELVTKANKTPQERSEMHKLMVELEKVWNEEQKLKEAPKS